MGNWLENVIGFISPKWAYQRAAWTVARQVAYDAGFRGRSNGSWGYANSTAEITDRGYRDIIRSRARDMERNGDQVEAIVGAFVRNVVGTGFRVQAQVKKNDGKTMDEATNAVLEDAWEIWQRPRNCDVTGQQSFSEMCRVAVRRMRVDGGVMFLKCYTAGGYLPFCLQMREVDDLDVTLTGTRNENTGNLCVGGIELDNYNKPVAFYLRNYSPDGFWSGTSARVEAERVIWLWDRRRPSQIREMSKLAVSLSRIRDMNEFMESVSVKERVAACLAAAITTETPPAGGIGRQFGAAAGAADPTSDYPQQTLTPGMIYHLKPGEDIKSVMPPQGAGNAAELLRTQQRLAGAGQGLSYEAMSRDLSQVNYSSIRQGRLDDQDEYAIEQQYLIEHLVSDVYETAMISAVLAGKFPKLSKFWDDKYRYLAHKVVPRGWNWIDPLKEASANNVALNTGQSTLQDICAAQGDDWQEVIMQRGRELKLMREQGIPIPADVLPKGVKVESEPGTAPAPTGK